MSFDLAIWDNLIFRFRDSEKKIRQEMNVSVLAFGRNDVCIQEDAFPFREDLPVFLQPVPEIVRNDVEIIGDDLPDLIEEVFNFHGSQYNEGSPGRIGVLAEVDNYEPVLRHLGSFH